LVDVGTDYLYGAVYSSDAYPYYYRTTFSNSTIENITSSLLEFFFCECGIYFLGATYGGVYTVWLGGSDQNVILFQNTSFKKIKLTSLEATYGGFVFVSGTPYQLLFQNSTFALGKVLYICIRSVRYVWDFNVGFVGYIWCWSLSGYHVSWKQGCLYEFNILFIGS
jgi:hypothetical protein